MSNRLARAFRRQTTTSKPKELIYFLNRCINRRKKREEDHSTLREKLESKGYRIVDEFQCKGFNTNSFMRFFGGMNVGRPNAEDLKNAKEFAQKIKQQLQRNKG